MGCSRRKTVQLYLWVLYALPMAASQVPSPAPTLAAREPDSPSIGDFALSLLHSLYPSSVITNVNDIQWPSTLPSAINLPSVIELPTGVTLPSAITLPTNFPSVINIGNGASTVTLTPSTSSTSSSTSSDSSSTLSTVIAKPTSTSQASPISTGVAADPQKHSNTGRLVGIILGTILGVALLLLLLLLFLLLRRNKRRSGSYFHRRPKTNHGSPYADENPTLTEYNAHPAYAPIVAPAVTHQNSRRQNGATYDEMMARDPFDDHLAQISRLEPQRMPEHNSGSLRRKPVPTATASYVPVSSDPFNEPSYMYANQDTSNQQRHQSQQEILPYQHHRPQGEVHPAFREPTLPIVHPEDSGNSSESLGPRRAPTPLDMMRGLGGKGNGGGRVSYVEDNAPYVPTRSPRRSRIHHPSTSEISDFDFGFRESGHEFENGHEYGNGYGNGNGGYGRRGSGGKYYSPDEIR